MAVESIVPNEVMILISSNPYIVDIKLIIHHVESVVNINNHVVTYNKELKMKSLFLKLYTYSPIVILVVGIIYVFIAPDVFRYPCQDPANWDLADCKPPMCQATGECTENLISNGDDIVTQLDKMKATSEALGISTTKTGE